MWLSRFASWAKKWQPFSRTDHETEIVFQKWDPDSKPIKRIALELPGFAGVDNKYDEAQPWQCKPFVDANTMGYEVCWAVNAKVEIESDDGVIAKMKNTWTEITHNKYTVAQFAPGYLGINCQYQITMPHGWGGVILPHPKWFGDPFNSDLPYVIPGLIEFDWWPKFFFVVVKVPPPGKKVMLCPGEPFFQIVPVPLRVKSSSRIATDEEALIAQDREKFINKHFVDASTHQWQTKTGNQFGNIYKVLAAEYKKNGKIDWDALQEKFP